MIAINAKLSHVTVRAGALTVGGHVLVVCAGMAALPAVAEIPFRDRNVLLARCDGCWLYDFV